MAKGKYARKRLLKQLRTRLINESGLSEWIIKALTRAEINTMADLFICNEESIKEVIAFPKVQTASCLMTGAPDLVDEKQLKELHVQSIVKEEK